MKQRSVDESIEFMLSAAREAGLEIDRGSAVLDSIGWDFQVLHGRDATGCDWILRAPKRAGLEARVRTEQGLLSLVRQSFPAEVPDWIIATAKIVAYPRLPGEPAASENIRTRIFEWRIDRVNPPERFIESFAACIASVQAVDAEEARKLGIPYTAPEDLRSRLRDKIDRAAADIGMHDSWYARGMKWIDNDELWPGRSVLIHGDIHPGHTMVDATGTIVGVIDWTDAEIGDPGQEFIGACRRFDSRMVDRLLIAYARHGGVVWSGLRRHIDEGIAFAPMFTGLYGLDCDQPTYVQIARDVLAQPTDT